MVSDLVCLLQVPHDHSRLRKLVDFLKVQFGNLKNSSGMSFSRSRNIFITRHEKFRRHCFRKVSHRYHHKLFHFHPPFLGTRFGKDGIGSGESVGTTQHFGPILLVLSFLLRSVPLRTGADTDIHNLPTNDLPTMTVLQSENHLKKKRFVDALEIFYFVFLPFTFSGLLLMPPTSDPRHMNLKRCEQ